VQGSVMGGNLSVLVSLLGTPWQVDFDDKILFLEEVGEKPYRVHRALMQLKHAGCLDSLRGVMLGQFINCNHKTGDGPDLDYCFRDIWSDSSIPVYRGVPSGHGDENYALPFGVPTLIDEEGIVCCLAT